MHAHCVYFSLKDNSQGAVQALIADCKTYLAPLPGIMSFACGPIDGTLDRPVNDKNFDVGLIVLFESRAAHDAYQTAPLHDTFVERNRDNWASVRVFDTAVS